MIGSLFLLSRQVTTFQGALDCMLFEKKKRDSSPEIATRKLQ